MAELTQTDDVLDVEFEEPKSELVNSVPIPAQTSPEWNAYILSRFTDDEKFNGNPTVDGLRRVAEDLIGDIVDSTTEILPMGNKICAVCMISFDTSLATDETIHILKRFSGAADAYDGNCDKPYNKYLTSMAETRAEGRALRKALRVKVVSAEELSEVANEDVPREEDTTKITDTQINFIDIMCRNDNRGLDINVKKFVQFHCPKVYNIREMLHKDSLAIQEKLSYSQQNTGSLSPDVRGYDPEWKKTFA